MYHLLYRFSLQDTQYTDCYDFSAIQCGISSLVLIFADDKAMMTKN